MRGHGRYRRFWQRWEEVEHSAEVDQAEVDDDYRTAWRRHFAAFLGVAPEQHWLFSGRRFTPWVSAKWGPPGLFNPILAVVMSKGGGLLSLYVLHLLSEKPRYGNDIMREIEERTGGRWGANPGAIYPLLTQIEHRGLVEGVWEDPDKRTRRIYKLTAEGRAELERLKAVMRPKLEEAINILHELHKDMQAEE